MSCGPAPAGQAAEAALASRLLAARSERDALLGPTLFGEPAWEILLRLFVAQAKGAPVRLSDLTSASSLPSGVALRWVSAMEEAGKLILEPGVPEPEVRLTRTALGQMQDLLRSWSRTAPSQPDRVRE